ncbi:hypothetical protein ACFLRY_04145 [Bacteroidota bacterium]
MNPPISYSQMLNVQSRTSQVSFSVQTTYVFIHIACHINLIFCKLYFLAQEWIYPVKPKTDYMNQTRRMIITVFVSLLLWQCNNPQQTEKIEETLVQKTIPEGAILFQFKNHIIFTGSFNESVKAKWVYDTGCPYAIVDSTFYEENGYSFEDALAAYTFGAGNSKTKTYISISDNSVGVDTLKEHPGKIYLLDLRKAVGDKKADGILQVKYFGDKIIEINYQDEYLLIHPDTFEPDSSWTKIPFEFTSKKAIHLDALVEVEPGKIIKGKFLLDLGSGGSFGIGTNAANNVNIENSSKEIQFMDLQSGGIGGGSVVGLIEVDKCGIGPYQFTNVPVTFSSNTNGALSNKSYNGLIGNRIMSRFHLIIDFIHNCIYIKPNKYFHDEIRRRDILGLRILDRTISEGGFKVNGIVRGSYVDSIGLKLGDIITVFDGKNVTAVDEAYDFYRKLDSITEIREVKLMIKRGDKQKEFLLRK